jgi:flagellar hook-associated protein 3 FlgL
VNGTPAASDTFQITQGTTQSVFDMLDQAIAALNAPVTNDADRAKLDDAVRQAAASLEQAFDNALSKRAEVGGRMNALDQATRVSDEVAYQGKVLLGEIQDVDYAEMASKFTQQQVALQAALSAYAQTSRLSLFDYLR